MHLDSGYSGFTHAHLFAVPFGQFNSAIQHMHRKEARGVYKQLLSEVDERVSQLHKLVSRASPDFDGSPTYASLKVLNTWFVDSVFASVAASKTIGEADAAVAFDVGVFQSVVLLTKVPGSRWTLETGIGPSLSSYHYPKVVSPQGATGARIFRATYIRDAMATLISACRGDESPKQSLARDVRMHADRYPNAADPV